MDDKRETKKRVKKDKKSKTTREKDKKGKKKSTKKSKKVETPNQFVQVQGKGQAGLAMGQTQPFGAGGFGGFLSSLGIQPKFNQLGGTTGFTIPTQHPIKIQQVAPKMEEKYIVGKEYSPEESQKEIDMIYKR